VEEKEETGQEVAGAEKKIEGKSSPILLYERWGLSQ
jgi:hypothetical protein